MKKKVLLYSMAFLMAAPLGNVKASDIYTVKSGDTLWGISNKYNISVSELLNWNGLTSNEIHVGQNLKVNNSNGASNGGVSTAYTVKSGDTLWGIATKHNVTVQQLMTINKLSTSTVFVGQKLVISQSSITAPTNPGATNPTTQTYTVKAGDTLWGISRDFKVNVNDIIQWNNLKSSTLYIGQKLNLKASTTTPTTPTQPPTSSTKVYAIVTASALNLRTSPDGSVITVMPIGTRVEILSTSNGWNKVQYGNTTGWASISYLKLDLSGGTQTPTTPPVTDVKYAYVSASALNLRTAPNGSVITLMPNGAKVQILETSNGWSKVKYGSTTGWASSEYLVESNNNQGTGNGQTVLLDPGHGGVDSGAVNGSYYEKHLTMTLANKTKNYLENMGYKVVLTRSGDSSCLAVYSLTPDLQCRVDKSRQNSADVFVSIHINAAVPGAIGTETYYNANGDYDGSINAQPEKSKLLAQSIHNRYQPAMGSNNRGVMDSGLYVLRKNSVPATLLEIGFISDYRDLNKMINPTYQNNISSAIAQGINDYFKKVN